MASPYKGLQRCVNVSANNSETVGHKDLRLGKIVYILVIYNNSFSWLLPLDGFQFNLLLGDSENDLLCNYNRTSPLARRGGGGAEYCHIWAIFVCAALKDMVFKQFTLG